MDIKLIITVINFAVYRTSESWLCVGNYMQSESLKSLKSRSSVLLPIQILTSTWNIAKYNLTKSISNLVQRNQTEHYKVMIVLTAVANVMQASHLNKGNDPSNPPLPPPLENGDRQTKESPKTSKFTVVSEYRKKRPKLSGFEKA